MNNQRNNSVRNIIIGAILLIMLCCCTVIIAGTAYAFWPETANTQPVAEAPAQPYDPNPIAYAQAPTCESLAPGETRMLEPGQAIAGDVYAMSHGEKVKFFDDGIGEYTIIRNISDETVTVVAPDGWGAGCLVSVDAKTLVNGEFENPNHTDIVRVRLVTFSSADSYIEKMYTNPIP